MCMASLRPMWVDQGMCSQAPREDFNVQLACWVGNHVWVKLWPKHVSVLLQPIQKCCKRN